MTRGEQRVSRRSLVAGGFAAVLGRAAPNRLLVSKKGRGYRTVQEAIDAVPVRNKARWVIEIAGGRYMERITIPRNKPFIRLVGEDAERTVLTYNLSTATTAETRYSASSYVFADNFQAEKITFENSYGRGSQAVALFLGADRAVLRNCRFVGWQDTLYANGPGCHFVPQSLAAIDAADCPAGRQCFEQCYIEGHVDFIFGNAAAVFHECRIHSKGPGYIAAQSRTYPAETSGFVFNSCRLTGENTREGVYLGRPWRAFSHVVYLNCWLGAHIRPEGWSVWRGNNNHETALFAEYRSQGPGAAPERRVPWSRQLSADEAGRYTTSEFLKGSDGWQPNV